MPPLIVSLTYQFLGRACDRATTLSNTLPSGSRQQLAESFAEVLSSVILELEEFLGRAPKDEEIDQRCRHLIALVDRFTNLMLPIFERPEVPGIVNDLTLSILRFTPDKSHYIGLIPSNELTFETAMISVQHVWSVLSFREEKVQAADASVRFFIKYPHLFSNDALCLVGLGHELSHVWYQVSNAADFVAPMIKMDSATLERISNDRGIPAGSDQQIDFYQKLQSIAASWAEEITCDIAAIHLLGPACLFAHERTVELSGGHNFGTQTHPDSAWRCRLMLEQLSLSGFELSKLKKGGAPALTIIPGCIAALQRMTDAFGTYTPDLDEAERVAYDALLAGLTKIRETVAGAITVPAITADDATQIVPEIVAAFSKGYPVSDIWRDRQNTAFDTRWLAFSLWEVYLRQQQDPSVSASELRSYEADLAFQFSRAINAAEVLARWRNVNARINKGSAS